MIRGSMIRLSWLGMCPCISILAEVLGVGNTNRRRGGRVGETMMGLVGILPTQHSSRTAVGQAVFVEPV